MIVRVLQASCYLILLAAANSLLTAAVWQTSKPVVRRQHAECRGTFFLWLLPRFFLLLFLPASSIQIFINISELARTGSLLPTHDFSVPAARWPPTWNGFCHHPHLFCWSCISIGFISYVPSQGPATMLICRQPDRARLRTPRSIACNGEAVRVRPHAHISDTAPAPVSEGKSKKGRVASAPDKKWKVIRW